MMIPQPNDAEDDEKSKENFQGGGENIKQKSKMIKCGDNNQSEVDAKRTGMAINSKLASVSSSSSLSSSAQSTCNSSRIANDDYKKDEKRKNRRSMVYSKENLKQKSIYNTTQKPKHFRSECLAENSDDKDLMNCIDFSPPPISTTMKKSSSRSKDVDVNSLTTFAVAGTGRTKTDGEIEEITMENNEINFEGDHRNDERLLSGKELKNNKRTRSGTIHSHDRNSSYVGRHPFSSSFSSPSSRRTELGGGHQDFLPSYLSSLLRGGDEDHRWENEGDLVPSKASDDKYFHKENKVDGYTQETTNKRQRRMTQEEEEEEEEERACSLTIMNHSPSPFPADDKGQTAHQGVSSSTSSGHDHKTVSTGHHEQNGIYSSYSYDHRVDCTTKKPSYTDQNEVNDKYRIPLKSHHKDTTIPTAVDDSSNIFPWWQREHPQRPPLNDHRHASDKRNKSSFSRREDPQEPSSFPNSLSMAAASPLSASPKSSENMTLNPLPLPTVIKSPTPRDNQRMHTTSYQEQTFHHYGYPHSHSQKYDNQMIYNGDDIRNNDQFKKYSYYQQEHREKEQRTKSIPGTNTDSITAQVQRERSQRSQDQRDSPNHNCKQYSESDLQDYHGMSQYYFHQESRMIRERNGTSGGGQERRSAVSGSHHTTAATSSSSREQVINGDSYDYHPSYHYHDNIDFNHVNPARYPYYPHHPVTTLPNENSQDVRRRTETLGCTSSYHHYHDEEQQHYQEQQQVMPPLQNQNPCNQHESSFVPSYFPNGGNYYYQNPSHQYHHDSTTSMGAPSGQLLPYYRRRILPLATNDDENWLSEFLCYVRSDCVEVFKATAEDVAARMNSKKVLEGQVGIRCKFCAHLPHRERTGRSSSFPSSIDRIYQSLTMMLRDHFTKCAAMPTEVRDHYLSLKANASQGATDSKRYWIDSAHILGLRDTEDSGIRFSRTPPNTP